MNTREARSLSTDEGPSSGPECAVCGTEMDWEDCFICGGEGGSYPYDLSPIEYEPNEWEKCDNCEGRGGWLVCHNCREGAWIRSIKFTSAATRSAGSSKSGSDTYARGKVRADGEVRP